jgi:hypothetical protein
MASRRRLDLAATLAIVAVAGAYVVGVIRRRAQRGEGVPSFDIYAAHYPNIIYALRSVAQGHGLLWNRLQNCGQPFLPSTLMGVFYPLHIIFLVFDIDTGFLVMAALHLSIGGIGTYLLCRELDLSRVASLCGAFCFSIGGTSITLATWLPTTILGVYVWMPAATLLCERLLKAPRVATALGLGTILTLQLLPGYPQILLFTYQFIALRVLWEFATSRVAHPARLIGSLALGAGLPLLLGAAEFLPMMEFARASIRSGALTRVEFQTAGYLTWSAYRTFLRTRDPMFGSTFAIVPVAVAALAVTATTKRRVILFYFLAGALYFALAFDNPLFDLYRQVPVFRSFRGPVRFLWVTGFAFSVLVAFGAEAITRWPSEGTERQTRLMAPVAGVAAFAALSASLPLTWEWLLVGGTCIGTAGAIFSRRGLRIARVVLPALVLSNLFAAEAAPYLNNLKDASVLYKNAAAFAFVKARATPQDRMYQFGKHPAYAVMPKSASIFDVPSITDYEPQTSSRFAGLFVRLLYDHPMRSFLEFMYRLRDVPTNRPLLNLLATRYLVVDLSGRDAAESLQLPLLWQRDGIWIYENTEALPRALYVPRVEVLADPELLLARLASAEHRPREVALVETPPPDGFVGSMPVGTGSATIVRERSEELALHVQASADGFLSLTDQYYPGWTATVNGAPVPILRGNYAFRVVRVPAGESEVVFRYRPRSVQYGVVLSLVTLAAIVLYALIARRSRRRPFTP